MTLYEEYQNGLNPVIYCEKAYNILSKAVLLTAKEKDITDERDIEVLWKLIIHIGNLDLITEKYGARDLVKSSFNTFDNYIDSRQLAMIRDYENMDITDFLSVYTEKKEIKRDKNRVIKNTPNTLEFMDCASTKGIYKPNNEDFTCILESPINNKIKMLLLCDGMGGYNNGEEASKIVAEEIITWFNSHDFTSGFDDVEISINKAIDKSRETIRENYFMSGTTLTFAIVGEKETLIGNAGDSRTYIIKDNSLTQITKDDSKVWEEFYENTKFPYEKDMLRFLPYNYVLTNAIDDSRIPVSLKLNRILNDSYDGILLVSDGVSDILSDTSINKILKEEKASEILDKILYESCMGDPDYPTKDYDEVLDEILYPTLPGKDNASAAIYLKSTNMSNIERNKTLIKTK